jgi:5-(carboxyamino)imidazole ribonucleotide synthase
VTEVHAQAMPAQRQEQAVYQPAPSRRGLQYVGVLCVEYFVLADSGSLVVNEMAPRPHNSGHYSMDACDVSQFDLQVRAMTGLPLVQPRQHSAAIMLNLLGDYVVPPGRHGADAALGPGAGPARHPPAPVRQGRCAARAARWAT